MVNGRPLSERLGAMGVRADVHRLQHRLPADACDRPAGHAAPRLDLSRGDRLGPLNLISTDPGSIILAAGILLFVIDVLRRLRITIVRSSSIPGMPGTLEWLPADVYSTPQRARRGEPEPLWDDPKLSAHVEAGRYLLPTAPTHGREVLATTPIDGKPDYLIRTSGNGWRHVIAAVFVARPASCC